MFIHFNKQKLHVQVVCGVNEEYKPSDKIKELENLVKELNDKVTKFREEQVTPEIQKIENLIKEVNPSQAEEN